MAAVSRGKAAAVVSIVGFVVAAGVLGFFLYSAYSERVEAEESLEEEKANFQRFNSAKTFPSKKSIADVKTNTAAYAQWHDTARVLAARGDKSFPDETETVFKQRLQSEVRRMHDLPGGAEGGKIALPTFFFGFDKYLGDGGVLPARADIPRLASQLDTITHVVDLCAKAGVLEIKSVSRVEPAAVDEDEDSRPRSRKKKRKSAKSEEVPEFTSLDYSFEIAARPAAIVKVLNALTSDERFMVVSNFSLRESADMIVDKLNAVAAEETKKAAPRRRGRRGRGADSDFNPEEAKTDSKADRLVVDPEMDAPILVAFKLTTYDFGSKSERQNSEEGK